MHKSKLLASKCFEENLPVINQNNDTYMNYLPCLHVLFNGMWPFLLIVSCMWDFKHHRHANIFLFSHGNVTISTFQTLFLFLKMYTHVEFLLALHLRFAEFVWTDLSLSTETVFKRARHWTWLDLFGPLNIKRLSDASKQEFNYLFGFEFVFTTANISSFNKIVLFRKTKT